MAKPANSVIGIDLGKHVFKSVLLQRKGEGRIVLTNYASHVVPDGLNTPDDLAAQLKLLLKEMGGSAKVCAVAASDPDSLLRIIEQPTTPVELLRSALKLNGLAVLNQECRDFVLDCAPVSAVAMTPVAPDGSPMESAPSSGKTRYLVGGMLRPAVKQISDAMTKMKRPAGMLQLAPVCSFNAFEFAYPEVFAKEAFLLLDMGHEQSTVLIGNKTELMLVRSIDYGGKIFGGRSRGERSGRSAGRPGVNRTGRRRHERSLPQLRFSASPPKCATRSDFSKANRRKASTGFSSPAAWRGRK